MSETGSGTPASKVLHSTPTVALLTNVIAPYRVPIYNALARSFHLHLLCSGKEANRSEWASAEQLLRNVRVRRSAGFTFKYFSARSGQAYDERYLHINPGYLLDLTRIRPDAVISTELGFRTLCAQMYCARARVPHWIWWEGSIDTERDVGALRRLLRRALVARGRHWLSGGRNATRYLLSMGVAPSAIVTAQNCVDERTFRDAPAGHRQLGPAPVILVVSRLVPGKGIGLLLEALARLRDSGRRFSVSIVGDGPDRGALQRQAAALSLEMVTFHLAMPSGEMSSFYRSADFLVLPTLHDVWGLVVNEALWSGLPVLASRYAGCAEELLPPAQVFDPLDPADLQAKLARALDHGLPAVDTSAMMPIESVANEIVESITNVLTAPAHVASMRKSGSPAKLGEWRAN